MVLRRSVSVRFLIIPDIHNETANADHWLNAQQFDRAIFLGDYFDRQDDNANASSLAALWLRRRMDSSSDIFLLGNHDAAYMFSNDPQLYCPGFTKAKASAIHQVLRPEHWAKFQLAHFEQSWLISHAGFHPTWIEQPTVSRILSRCEKAMALAKRGKVDPILAFGEVRGGLQRFGGPLWMDWDSLFPIPGINQIVGHTAGEEVRKKVTPESKNYCLDVKNASVAAILADGELTILRKE